MTKTCSKCNKPAITFIRYNGTHLCMDHFNEYFIKRVKKDIKKQGKTTEPCTIGVAVSGGKDSAVALQMMHDIFSKRPHIQLIALTVDEGIRGYRDISIGFAQKVCQSLNVEHHIITFKERVGKTMDEIAVVKDELGECSFCGVFRRFCLNIKAKELGIQKLVTGHNLDDVAQSILMNFINNDLQKLARLGPHKKVQPGLVPRVLPLRSIPEKEVMLYAILNNIAFHNAECPYALRASRQNYRELIDTLEYKNPGTRHSILNSYDAIKDKLLELYPPAKLNVCADCGEPASQKTCKTCQLLNKIN